MKFDTPATTNPIDQLKVIGKATDRIDGPLKTTGRARYAYERHDVVSNPAYGYVVGSAIAKGRIASIDLTDAKAVPGVLAIVTADNAGKLDKGKLNTATLLGGPEIQHYHQAIAVVVAETFEQARAAAQLIHVDYVREQGSFDLASLLDKAKPRAIPFGSGGTSIGGFAAAFAAAPVRLDARYSTPDEAHAMMEPHATIAAWEGDKLTLWTSNQMIAWNKAEMAKILGMPLENVRLDSPFIGGGFGGKLFPRADALLAALGARAAKRPVKVALQRPLMFNNTTQVDPEKPKRPCSQRQLTECLRTGAERFGWSKRNPHPGRVRDGRWLVGIGAAAAFRNNLLTKSAARVRLDNNGIVTVETDMTDIGTGSYTIIAQTAAEMMGVPLEKVKVRLGDSAFPVSSGSGGQWGGNNSTAGVYAACVKLREAIAQKLGFNSAEVEFADGEVRAGNRSVPLAQAAGESGLSAEDEIEYGDLAKKYQQSTFGAHFVEVGVDAATAEIRVRRMLAVCAAGRILNPKTARSQVIGAMTMGVGAALMEELVVDKRAGFFVNHDLAGYEVPVHADIPHQEMFFLDETDPMSSPMKAKGVAELGICGVAAAVANAVYNATGVRVRDYPITLDKLLEQMPDVG